MTKVITILLNVFFICFIAVSACYAEEYALFDRNSTASVYLIKGTLEQVNQAVRSVWVKYEYTKMGKKEIKTTFNTKKTPESSKVKYAFDCNNKQHKVMQANIYDNNGASIKSISNARIEDVIPGSVGEAIRNFTCDYDMENNKPGTN